MNEGGLRIAIIGSRGIPARYGGFETLVAELAPRLVELGHDVTVYCREGYTGGGRPATFEGVRLIHTPYLRSRSLETLSHELSSILDSLRRRFDLYYFLGTRGAPVHLIARATGRRVVVHTDGIEWKRRKWGPVARAYLRAAEWLSARVVAQRLVTDAEAMRAHYLSRYGAGSSCIPYGARIVADAPDGVLESHGLTQDDYYLVVCRIEPENNVDLIVREFLASGTTRRLVLVGGANYETSYTRSVLDAGRGDRVRSLGPVYGEELDALRLGAYAYLHGHEVGGLNPSLLEAMGAGECAIALDTPFSREALGEAGLFWDKAIGSLTERIRWADANPEELRAIGAAARARARERYLWESVARQHDALFREMVSAGS